VKCDIDEKKCSLYLGEMQALFE